jgi:integrase
MNGRNALAESDAGGPWSEPAFRSAITPADYDRSPTLSPIEATALGAARSALARWRDPAWPWRTDLARVVRPLADAAAAIELPSARGRRSRDEAVALVLAACADEGRSVWGLTPATWVRLVGADQASFFASHAGPPDPAVRSYIMALGYLLGCFTDLARYGRYERERLARKVFGRARVDAAVGQVRSILRSWGYQGVGHPGLSSALCEALLAAGSPRLADLTTRLLERLRAAPHVSVARRSELHQVQRALAALGIAAAPASPGAAQTVSLEGVDPAWAAWIRRWLATTTVAPATRKHTLTGLARAGRWLVTTHPDVTEPGGWTRELCAAYVAALDRSRIGEHTTRQGHIAERLGQPLSARTKEGYLGALRAFFGDCQEWGWIGRRFDPGRALATPRSVKALIGPKPRVIADEIWAKLLWAGLNLAAADLPPEPSRRYYPPELVRAIAITWLFGGLRSDEIRRLRRGCVRWQTDAGSAGERRRDGSVCLLDVPAHKTGTTFTKPVDPLVGEAIAAWETIRPNQPAIVDPRTGESVELLFSYRARPIDKAYLNRRLIPLLCAKAGVPTDDARGPITSHRARSTIASQLYNAKEPLTLFELQAWLGHRSPATTQHYAQITPATLSRAYADAGYFARNVRVIEVLLDREAIETGAAAAGRPWQFFDLGHGHCTYSFFEQCRHRMACARCDFYVPKASTAGQLLEARGNLQRMLCEIPLTDDERAAVEDGAMAIENLLNRLADVPTPAGPTPRQLMAAGRQLPVIDSLPICSSDEGA